MINRDGREKRKRKEDKVTDVSTKEKNNQHIHYNMPYLLNLRSILCHMNILEPT